MVVDVPTNEIAPDLLAKVMDRGNWTPSQLAERVHISRTYMADILSGRRTLRRNPELRHAMAEALEVPYSWIERERRAS